jgi:hypothetical protein
VLLNLNLHEALIQNIHLIHMSNAYSCSNQFVSEKILNKKKVLIQDFLKQMKPIEIEQSLNYFHYDMYMKQRKRML